MKNQKVKNLHEKSDKPRKDMKNQNNGKKYVL